MNATRLLSATADVVAELLPGAEFIKHFVVHEGRQEVKYESSLRVSLPLFWLEVHLDVVVVVFLVFVFFLSVLLIPLVLF